MPIDLPKDVEASASPKLLFHWKRGISRSAAVMMGYLMVTNGINFEEAFNMVKKKRPTIDPNIGFVSQLQWLDEFLNKHNEDLENRVFDYEEYKKFSK